VAEGEDGNRVEGRLKRTVGRLWLRRLDAEARVEAWQEAVEHFRASAIVAAPAWHNSVTSRSWSVPAKHSTRPLACGERANTWVIPSSLSARANWLGGHRPARLGGAWKTPWRSV